YAHEAEISQNISESWPYAKNCLVHGYLSPRNILLKSNGEELIAKIGGFILAKSYKPLVMFRHLVNNRIFYSPIFFCTRQQIINRYDLKPAVDVWQAAALYYYMLTGKYVRDFDNNCDVLVNVLTQRTVPIRQRLSDIPEKLAQVIDYALKETPQSGVKSALELKKMIESEL
ncbi:MAG: serine/threonine protein kinase, partial [Deltaproteobacteria bacterium]|nr:serine/threonine protein kinase [Deltaproteobacteria bacterium]